MNTFFGSLIKPLSLFCGVEVFSSELRNYQITKFAIVSISLSFISKILGVDSSLHVSLFRP